MRFWNLALPLLCACVLATANTSWSDQCAQGACAVPDGPLQLSNSFLLSQPHLTLRPQSAWLTAAGDVSFTMLGTWGNDFVLDDAYLVDGESRTLEFNLAWGFAPRWETGIRLPLWWRGGGVLDSLIEGWHELFSLANAQRDQMPQDTFSVERFDGAFNVGDGTSIGNIELALRRALSHDAEFTTAVGLEASLPTTREGFGHRSVDVAVRLDGGWRSEPWRVDAGIAMFWYPDQSVAGVSYRSLHSEGFVSLRYRLNDTLSLLATLVGGQQGPRHLTGYPNGFLYLDFGARYLLSSRSAMVAMLRENPWSGDGSTDVSFTLALEHRL